MVTFEEIIKIDFFKWAQLFVRPPRVSFTPGLIIF